MPHPQHFNIKCPCCTGRIRGDKRVCHIEYFLCMKCGAQVIVNSETLKAVKAF